MLNNLVNTQFVRVTLAGTFFLFICWVIYTADKGQVHPYLQQFRDIPYGDKVGHFLLYGLLAFMVNLALENKKIKIYTWSVLLGSVLIGVFAIAEEFTQLAFATRKFEVADMICDILGIALFSQIAVWLNRYAQKKESGA